MKRVLKACAAIVMAASLLLSCAPPYSFLVAVKCGDSSGYLPGSDRSSIGEVIPLPGPGPVPGPYPPQPTSHEPTGRTKHGGSAPRPSYAPCIAATGELTLKEADLQILGRGFDLVVERIWCTPLYWQNDAPYGFENSTTNLGKGWFLNFPWIGRLLHLWDGECYELKWAGNVFENHEREHFKLVKESNGSFTLYYPSGTILTFNSAGKLTRIKDINENAILFVYNSGLLVNIIDTVGRVVFLQYSNGRLVSLSYDSMTVEYTYSNDLLVKVKDVHGRYCYYSYYRGYGAWLLYKVTNFDGAYTTYTYTKLAKNSSVNTFYKFKIASANRYNSDGTLVSKTLYRYVGNFSSTSRSVAICKDELGKSKTETVYAFDTEGRVTSISILNSSAAEYNEYSETRSINVWGKTDGTGHWEGSSFFVHCISPQDGQYVNLDTLEIWIWDGAQEFIQIDDGWVEVGPFENYTQTRSYRDFEIDAERILEGYTITVTVRWTNRTVPLLKKILYTYNANNEVIAEDYYLEGNETIAYSVQRRCDNWGNQIYLRSADGHESFYSYSNTITSGVFIDFQGNPRTDFSNVFYQNILPSNIHSLSLGTAELQDDDIAIETYQKYDSKGNLIETRNIFGNRTPYLSFSGTFDETGSTSFQIDLSGINIGGCSMLKIEGMPMVNQIEYTEVKSATGVGFTGTGYWKGKYFYAYWLKSIPGGFDDGYTPVGPFTHYLGTTGYKKYTTSVSPSKTQITITTYYNMPTDCYPQKVKYHLDNHEWKTVTNCLNASMAFCSIPPSELACGVNTLYFYESSLFATKFSWNLYVPIYTVPIEDLKAQFTYDNYGNVISVTDLGGMITRFEYGPEYEYAFVTKIIRTINGQNITVSNTYYFAKSLIASTMDPYGYVTSYEYDDLGRTTKIINPDGSQRNIVYDDENNTETYYDELGHFRKVYYDGFRRPVKAEAYLTDNEIYSIQTCTYNYLSEISTWTVPHKPDDTNFSTYTYEYDVLGRTTKSVNPDDTFSEFQYDEINNILTAIDASQHKKECKYDWAGRLLWVREYYDNTSYYLTQYEYDELGHIVRTVDANGQATITEYGSRSGETRIIYPDLTTTQFAYNDFGNVKWTVNRNGDNTTYTYDELHRLEKITFADSTTRIFVYDKCSRLISTSHRDYSCTYQYDCRGRLVWESHAIRGGGPDSYNVLFVYDVADRLTKMIYPNGVEVSYEYDNLNRIIQIYSGDYVFASFEYNADNTLDLMTYGNGLQTVYTYDSRLRPTHIALADPNQSNLTILSLDYTYDGVGNVRQITNGRRTPSETWLENVEVYDFDWLDRLVLAQGGFGNIQYSYDAVGNRMSEIENGVTTTYQYDACNRLVSYQNNSTSANFTYDEEGNLIAKTVNGGTWQYIYNKENRLNQVVKGQLLGSYIYDSLGRRVHQLEGSKTTTTVYSGINPIYEHIVKSANHTVFNYIYGPTGRIARVAENHIIYYHNDHLGSTRLVTDMAASVVATVGYKPFGEKYEAYGMDEKFGFTGKEEDSQTGLYYFGSRYYDPEIGRFIQEDNYWGKASSPQSQNRYAYCSNNPLKYVDPTGNKRHHIEGGDQGGSGSRSSSSGGDGSEEDKPPEASQDSTREEIEKFIEWLRDHGYYLEAEVLENILNMDDDGFVRFMALLAKTLDLLKVINVGAEHLSMIAAIGIIGYHMDLAGQDYEPGSTDYWNVVAYASIKNCLYVAAISEVAGPASIVVGWTNWLADNPLGQLCYYEATQWMEHKDLEDDWDWDWFIANSCALGGPPLMHIISELVQKYRPLSLCASGAAGGPTPDIIAW